MTMSSPELRPLHFARLLTSQEKTRDAVKVQSQEYPAVSGNARAYFKVVWSEYRQDGPVEAWRFTVWRGGQIVAEEQSFIW